MLKNVRLFFKKLGKFCKEAIEDKKNPIKKLSLMFSRIRRHVKYREKKENEGKFLIRIRSVIKSPIEAHATDLMK
jgi:hypothetical protein